MNFSCENCQRRYSIADERILERAIRVRCKQCGTIRSIGPLMVPPDAGSSDASGASGEERTRMVGLEELERLKAQAGPESGAGPWGDEPTRTVPQGAAWFAMIQGKQEGPFDLDALSARISAGAVQPRTFVWKEGMADWKRAADVSELAVVFRRSAAEAHSDTATQTQRPRTGKVRVVHPRAAEPSPDSGADAAPVTASQILDTEDVQRALQATRPPAATPRRPTAELNAAELFGGLELSKISRMPQPPDLSDLLEPRPTHPAIPPLDAADLRQTQPSLPAAARPGSGATRAVRRARPASQPSVVTKAVIALAVVILVTATGLAAASSVGLIRLEVGAIDATSGAHVNVPLLSPQGWQALSARLSGESPRVRAATLGAPTPPPAVAQPASP